MGGPTTTPILQRTMAAVLERWAEETPDKPALIEPHGRTVTYQELQQLAYTIAHSLNSEGLARQDIVLVMLDNHIDMVAVWFGLGVNTAIAALVNTAFRGELLRNAVERSEATIAIVEDCYLERLEEVLETTSLRTVYVRRADGSPAERTSSKSIDYRDFADLLHGTPVRPAPPHVSDIACIINTSGTEGRSKGVLIPHGQAFLTAGAHSFTTVAEDVVLVVLPLFHAGGLFAGVYNALRAGATAVIEPSFSVNRFWRTVREFGCTQTELIGSMVEFLLRQPASAGDSENPLRNATILPALPTMTEFARRFGVSVASAFGQTECGCACLTDLDDEVQPFVCGRPRPEFEVRIVDDDDVEVAGGITGEILIRSTEPWAMFRGYHQEPVATVHATRNGWVHTGDAGYVDEDGRLVFVDRKRDALRRRGENVSSMEVERHLVIRADIVEAAIIAIPSEHVEDDIKAVVVLADGAAFEPEVILRDLVARLPYFMVPRYYEAVDALPRTVTQKVSKAELREAGITPRTWDCEAHGFMVTRSGLRVTFGAVDLESASAGQGLPGELSGAG